MLEGKEQFIYRIPVTPVRLEEKFLCVECAENQQPDRKNYEAMHYNDCKKCDARLCIEQCFEVYHSKLNYWK
jgi:hypothetical protein